MSVKNKVGVLMGGLSRERDVSLRGGQAVADALKRRGYDIVAIDVGRDVATILKQEKISLAFVILHGRYGEDGTLQGLLEVMGIPYTGSGPLPSAIAMDKDLTKRLLVLEGVRTPEWKVICGTDGGSIRESPYPLPVIVKPNCEGSTLGISIVRKEVELEAALREAFAHDKKVLIEKYIAGREMTVAVLNGRALPVLEIVPKTGFYDYAAKYTKGMTSYRVPAPISDDVRDRLWATSEKIYRTLELSGVARMDFILDEEGRDFFLEVNTLPGMTETSLVPKAAAEIGLTFEGLCEDILKGASLKV